VHGANRLASNSLLEGLVYGARAAQEMRDHRASAGASHSPVLAPLASASNNGQGQEIEKLIRKAQSLMWQQVGVVRDGRVLQQVVPELRSLLSQLPKTGQRRSYEALNILETGLLIARAASARQESRGAHYRLDHPLKDDARYRRHSVITGDTVQFV
jgi:L-aspartate oxidase